MGAVKGRYSAMKATMVLFVGAAVGLSLITALYAGGKSKPTAFATRKAFVDAHMPAGASLKLRTVAPSAEVKRRITEHYAVDSVDDSIGYVLGRTEDDKIAGVCVFVERDLAPYAEPHHVAVALTPSGTVETVALIGPHGEFVATLQTPVFLTQFARKQPADGYRLGRDIDAVTGATMSSELVVDVVNMVMGVYHESVAATAAK
ncbi:MAG: FMN-binding protein [Chitinivibrionales bacterium]|nr:FMN-binding protein [Chitinivibrionales bacterium]